jgi:hypothetical protein
MKRQKILALVLAGLMLMSPASSVGVYAAEGASPEVTPEVSASPVASPEASATPSPSAEPSPSPVVSPVISPEASVAPASPAAASSPSPTGTPQKVQTGPDKPTGVIPDYVFDVAAQRWVPADKESFTYDKASGYWVSPKYYVNTRTGWYTIEPASAPISKEMITAPHVVHTVLGDMVVGSPDYQMARVLGIIGANGEAVTANNTGAGSNNQGTVNNSDQTWFDLTNLVNVVNSLQSAAQSGTVTADSNTRVGDVSTGAVSVVANLINLLASAWSWSHGNLSTFVQNLFGNMTGDIHLQPTETATAGGGGLGGSASNTNTGAGSNNAGTVNNDSTLDVNAKNSGSITNNVDLTARSGDANVNANTEAGNVATGNAVAEVNIINLINSFINSGSSFFGILNIFGNLNGDILFPDGFLNGLLSSGANGGAQAGASGTGAGSNNTGTVNNTNNATINNSSNQSVLNDVQLTAQSGAANASRNTESGNLGTGGATTTNSLFNLANSSVFGDNAVLVIVNVMGHWVGKIMSLPGGGTQSALLTGNATVENNNTGAGSSNAGTVNNTNTTNINQESVGTITNNVKVGAQSGDANVTDNTKVGDVQTGTAKAASSVANIFNSVLNVKHWFGVLVINVFGTWTGSVNENTAAGNGAGGMGSGPQEQLMAAVTPTQASSGTGWRAAGSGAVSTMGGMGGGQAVSGTDMAVKAAAVGGVGAVLAAAAQAPSQTAAIASSNNISFLFIVSALILLIAGALFSLERKLRH